MTIIKVKDATNLKNEHQRRDQERYLGGLIRRKVKRECDVISIKAIFLK